LMARLSAEGGGEPLNRDGEKFEFLRMARLQG
jgi:hypothetical protein